MKCLNRCLVCLIEFLFYSTAGDGLGFHVELILLLLMIIEQEAFLSNVIRTVNHAIQQYACKVKGQLL